MKYRDTSKIITFYTKEYGKIKGIAKGARTANNKFRSALEPLSYVMLVFYKKEHRDLHLISQCDAIDSFKSLTEDLNRMSVSLSVLELSNQVTHDEEHNPALFQLVLETLQLLNASVKNETTYLHAFRLRLAALFGYTPNFDVCGECGKSIVFDSGERKFAFQIARGALLCNQCCLPERSPSSSLDENTAIGFFSASGLQIARRLLHAQFATLGNLEYDMQIGNEIDNLLRLYLRYHFDGLKPLKSTELYQQHTILI